MKEEDKIGQLDEPQNIVKDNNGNGNLDEDDAGGLVKEDQVGNAKNTN